MTQIPNYEMYSATTEGDIYSHVNTQGNSREVAYKLTPVLDRNGYHIVGLHHKTKKVHRLVATTFIPNPHNHPVVNHLDGCKTNNNIDNLEWCSYADNTKHAVALGLCSFNSGEDHHASKLTDDETIELIKGTLSGGSNEELAERFNVHSRYVSLVRHKKRQLGIWESHFPDTEPVPSSKVADSKDPAKLTAIVNAALGTKKSNTTIGREFKVDPSAVSRIRSGNNHTSYCIPYIEDFKRRQSQTTIESTQECGSE